MNRDEKNKVAAHLTLSMERIIISMHNLNRDVPDEESEYNKLESILAKIKTAYNDLQ